MTPTHALRRRLACLTAGVAALALALPAGALATTGTQTDHKVKVTLTAKGVVWSPALAKLHPKTGMTFKFTILNQTTSKHWFSVGKRRSKVLPTGKTEVFFYFFAKPGTVPWVTGLGSVRAVAWHGGFKVTFPGQFN
jgi:hypothetical protein